MRVPQWRKPLGVDAARLPLPPWEEEELALKRKAGLPAEAEIGETASGIIVIVYALLMLFLAWRLEPGTSRAPRPSPTPATSPQS